MTHNSVVIYYNNIKYKILHDALENLKLLHLKANSEASVSKNFKTFSVDGSFDTLNSLVA